MFENINTFIGTDSSSLQLFICPERVEKLLPKVFFILEMYMLVRNVFVEKKPPLKAFF